MPVKMKVIAIGPCRSGKTLICNTIAEMGNSTATKYDPTEGLRILEVELQLKVNADNINVDIELWDCSGSSKYQVCWPVMQLDANGIIFVYDPDVASHHAELELLYDYFVTQGIFSESCCILFANQQTKSISQNIRFSNKFDGVTRKTINVLNDPSTVKSDFTDFVEILISELQIVEQNKMLTFI